jgi:hypothetical protein
MFFWGLFPGIDLVVRTGHFLFLWVFAAFHNLLNWDDIVLLADEWKMLIFEFSGIELRIQALRLPAFGRTGIRKRNIGMFGRNGSSIPKSYFLRRLAEDPRKERSGGEL